MIVLLDLHSFKYEMISHNNIFINKNLKTISKKYLKKILLKFLKSYE